MADEATLSEIINYYSNLLIIQYHNKPKAIATIQLFIAALLAEGIALDVREGYNIETAVGLQLDVIGKYENIDRFYVDSNLINFFSLTDYTETDPDSQEKFGFSEYDKFDEYEYNGTLTYNSVVSKNNRLLDESFRKIIKLAIIVNDINNAHKAIDQGIYTFFGTQIWAESLGGMKMTYFVTAQTTATMKAALAKKLLPRPMGVALVIVGGIMEKMFGLIGYSGAASPFAWGFSEYGDYDSLPGQCLVYNQISAG